MSRRYTLNKEDGKKILEVFGWTIGSATLGFIISLIPLIDVPAKYAVIVSAIIPTINTLLIAGKKFFEHKIEEV